MSLKGFPTQQKQVTGVKSHAEFVTVQPTADWRNALESVSRVAYRISTIRTAGADTGFLEGLNGTWSATEIDDSPNVGLLPIVPMPGDFVRFEMGAATALDLPIADIFGNSLILALRVPDAYAPSPGNTYYVMRYITPRYDESGAGLSVAAKATVKESVRYSYKYDGNVDNVSWTTIIASTLYHTTSITLMDAGGFSMELGIGGVRILLIPPGGFNGMIDLDIPAGSQLDIRAVGAEDADVPGTVSLGEVCINLLG